MRPVGLHSTAAAETKSKCKISKIWKSKSENVFYSFCILVHISCVPCFVRIREERQEKWNLEKSEKNCQKFSKQNFETTIFACRHTDHIMCQVSRESDRNCRRVAIWNDWRHTDRHPDGQTSITYSISSTNCKWAAGLTNTKIHYLHKMFMLIRRHNSTSSHV